MKYKGVNYRTVKNSFGVIKSVYVNFNNTVYEFETVKQAKKFISYL